MTPVPNLRPDGSIRGSKNPSDHSGLLHRDASDLSDHSGAARRSVRAIGGERTLPAATREALIQRYDLDEPRWKQYFLYMGDVFQGDFGESYANRVR